MLIQQDWLQASGMEDDINTAFGLCVDINNNNYDHSDDRRANEYKL